MCTLCAQQQQQQPATTAAYSTYTALYGMKKARPANVDSR